MYRRYGVFLYLSIVLAITSCGDTGSGPGGGTEGPMIPGQTDFTNAEPKNGQGSRNSKGGGEWDSAAPTTEAGSGTNPATPGAAPQGREGEVQEGDIYKIENNTLFYLNTYRGFMIFDVTDPKNPQKISRLPVYGYPIEMFVQNNTVYALLSDSLYLTQVNGKLQFSRHNVSQLVAIDISDLKNPKVLQTVDIIGELREGVSRKIEDTIYVVSYLPQSYYWDWNYGNQSSDKKEQAWVYSFNVADPKNLLLVDQLQIFEGGGYNYHDEHYNTSVNRWFSGVTIAATSNALMVVENWYTSGWVSNSPYNCGSWSSQEQAMVSIIDISDPQGKIRLHTKFETYGQLGDQFKQTYVFDEKTGKGTYYGIFARREWSSVNCQGSSLMQNTLEAWDITDGKNPKRVDDLAFGKPDETVRGSVFDPDRGVAYAITARNMDPLYALDISNPTDLKILSAVDGLSGDMSVFRFIQGKKFLIGIGRDNSGTCTGFGDPVTGIWSANIAVSIIDAQDPQKIRLVQRQCVAIKNAEWVGSELNWNLDQAHKMIGMHSDGTVNALTIPVYYYKKSGQNDWWWYNSETAVGLMTWDLSKYDPAKDELHQNVLQNYGTIIHPKGEVRRSIVFTHKGAQDRRMVINLSNTHIAVVDISDLNNPVTQSMVEIAPYQSQIFRFGNYMVEHISSGQYYYYEMGGNNGNASEFRVKPVGGMIEDTPAVASFFVGQVQRVVKYKDNLVLFRQLYNNDPSKSYWENYESEALVYNLADPTKPMAMGTIKLPQGLMPYYGYWFGGMDCDCGGRYWFNWNYSSNNWVTTDKGIVTLTSTYDYQAGTSEQKLFFLDLTNLTAPSLKNYTLTTSSDWAFFGLVSDPTDANSFYLTYRIKVGEILIDGDSFDQFKYYAQRWSHTGSDWVGDYAVNIPGQLMKIWNLNGNRMLLTYDYTYEKMTTPTSSGYPYDPGYTWQYSFRLNLLREVTPAGIPVAELLDFHNFQSFYLEDVIVDNAKLYVNARRDWYYQQVNNFPWYEVSDNLMIFDLSSLKLTQAYSEPTGTYSVQMMGTHQGKLFVNLPGDGVLVVDVTDPAKPVGQQFLRTLGYTTHIEFANNTAYLASGYFGIYQMDLSGAPTLPITN